MEILEAIEGVYLCYIALNIYNSSFVILFYICLNGSMEKLLLAWALTLSFSSLDLAQTSCHVSSFHEADMMRK